jgi:phage/plasmid-like protein (TIGR03299 family)
MAHNLFNRRIAFVGDVPWHKLGVQVGTSVTAAEMIRAARLSWKVELRRAPGARSRKGKPDEYDRYLIMREPVDEEKEEVALGMVGNRYVPLQNEEAFSFFEPFVQNGWAQFDTAGALGNGERVWVLAKLTGQIVVAPGDAIDRYLLLSNKHDGTGAVSIRFTPIRVVCQNTLNWAEEGGSSVISVRHSKNIGKNLKKAQAEEMKQIIDKVFAEAETLFGQMALRTMNVDDVDQFLELLFPRTAKQKKLDQEPERWARIRAVLSDSQITPVATRNTLWALYNAIIRAEDYRDARQDQAARLERVWFGSGHDLKVKALDLARQQLKPAA